MTVVVDTAGVSADERFELWRSVSARVYEPLAVRAARKRAFAARLERYRLGPLDVDHLTVDASTATRTDDLIRLQDPGRISFLLQLDGECFVAQDERDALLRPGDLTCWHSSDPYTIGGDQPFEVLMVRVPQRLFASSAGRVRANTAQRIDGVSTMAAVLRPYLVGMLGGLEGSEFDAEARGHLARGLLDLLFALYAAPAAGSRAEDLRTRISAYIDAHLFDSDLTSERIADDHFISRSYLDKLFAGEPTGVHRAIRDRRLERVRHDLTDPAMAGVPIADIAARWGFVSAAHFSRTFRKAYGLAPSDFRRLGSVPV